MTFKIFFGLLLLVVVLNATKETCNVDSPPSGELTVEYKQCVYETCHNNYPINTKILNQLYNWDVPDDKVFGENLLCVLKGLRVYSIESGMLNATDFAETVFNRPYHNQTIIKPIAKTCTEDWKQESEADVMIREVYKCTINGVGKDELFNKG